MPTPTISQSRARYRPRLFRGLVLDPACSEIGDAGDNDVEVDGEDGLLSLGLPESNFCLFFL